MAAAPPLPWDQVTRDAGATEALGFDLVACLRGSPVLHLHGDLGAGKTCLVRGLARALGADPADVHSPTFALVHTYRDAAGHALLHHIDLYRIEGPFDLREIGLEELLGDDTPTAVEWAERLLPQHPPRPGDLLVTLQILGVDERRITVTRVQGPEQRSG